jgi:hypothetical protein
MRAVIPYYEFTVTLPEVTGYEFTCDSSVITADDFMTVDSSVKPLHRYSATIPSFQFNYILPESIFLTSDNTYITSDNLITVDNG